MLKEQKLTVHHLYRKPKGFFSIERIFKQLEPVMSQSAIINQWVAPDGRFSPAGILKNIWAVKKLRSDVYHITGDVHYLALGLPSRRTLLTIHDCVFLYQSSGYKRKILKWLLLDRPVNRCKLITTISESTKNDIVKHTGCAAEKVVIIPNPVDNNIKYIPREFAVQEPVILFLGSTPNKNLPRVIAALENIPCLLNIVGEIPPESLALLKQTNIKYRQQVNLTDAEIANVYVGADIILFPSTFEGFGLPIIEAHKAGRPVLTSNLDPMKEVAGGAACLIDPFSVQSIREGILKIINDKNYREQLVNAGFKNTRRFDVKLIAQQYLSCYEKLLNDN